MSWDVANPLWRLDNLYYVKSVADGQPVLFHPKPEQWILINAIYVQGQRKILVPKARQLGISTVIAIIILDTLIFKGGTKAAIVDLTQADATTKLRDKIVFAFERLPAVLREPYKMDPNNGEAFGLRLKDYSEDTKSEVQAGMRVRGDTFQILHISEWGKIQFSDQIRSEEIMTGALPAAKRGIIFIETTWKGGKGGLLWNIMNTAMTTKPEHMTSEDFNLYFFPWWGDKDYSLEGDASQITEEVNRYLDETETTIANREGRPFHFSDTQRLWYYKVAWAKGLFRFEEYPSLLEECFKAPIEGAIYADLIDKLRVHGAIRPAEVDKTALVNTAWDLGSPINTVVWYFQVIGLEFRVIDCDMDRDETPTERVARMMTKGYLYGWHYLPHDAMATQKSGVTFQHELKRIGLDNTRVIPQTHDIWIGINHLREIFPRFTFRVPACERGIEGLSCYHTKRETSGGAAVDIPVHDWSSHPSDGLRVLAEAEMAGMIHATGPGSHRFRRPTVRAGFRGNFEEPKPKDLIEAWFDDRPKRPRVIR